MNAAGAGAYLPACYNFASFRRHACSAACRNLLGTRFSAHCYRRSRRADDRVLPVRARHSFHGSLLFAGFALFRAFRHCEAFSVTPPRTVCPAASGVIADDVGAGLYALAVTHADADFFGYSGLAVREIIIKNVSPQAALAGRRSHHPVLRDHAPGNIHSRSSLRRFHRPGHVGLQRSDHRESSRNPPPKSERPNFVSRKNGSASLPFPVRYRKTPRVEPASRSPILQSTPTATSMSPTATGAARRRRSPSTKSRRKAR